MAAVTVHSDFGAQVKKINPSAEAEAPILWLPGVKSRLTGKDPNAGKD